MLTERYQVPKRRVEARVSTPELDREPLTLFLADSAESHSGGEQPSDLLNGDDDFIVAERENGDIVFLNRRRILCVTVPLNEEAPPVDPDLEELFDDVATDVRVAVTLAHGQVLEGTAHYALPEANRRIQDFLNGPQSFVALRCGDEIELVNKHHVVRVEQLQSRG